MKLDAVNHAEFHLQQESLKELSELSRRELIKKDLFKILTPTDICQALEQQLADPDMYGLELHSALADGNSIKVHAVIWEMIEAYSLDDLVQESLENYPND